MPTEGSEVPFGASDPSVADYRATSPFKCYGVDTSFEGPLRRAAGERKGPIAQRWEGEVVMLFAGARHSSGAIFCLLEA